MRTLQQRLAESEAKTARLKKQAKQAENGTKFVVGGTVLKLARHTTMGSEIRPILIDELKSLTRKQDINRVQDLIIELERLEDEFEILCEQYAIEDIEEERLAKERALAEIHARMK